MISLKPLTALCFATLLGVSQAFGNVDCVGHWGTCSDKCLHTFHIDTKRSGDGKKCGMKDGTKQPCTGDKCKKPPHSSSGLHSIFNAAEVEKCYGLISKSPQLVRADKRIFLISACRRGGPNSYFKSSYKSNYTASAHSEKYAGNYTASVARRRLDPTSKSVAIIKSSSDDGKTWGDFRVVSQHGFDGSHYYGTKGIYDKKRKRLIIQYTEGHNDDTITLWQVTSDDEGKTFSKPRDLTHYIAKCAPKGGKPRSGNTAGNRIQLPLKQYPNGRVVFGTGAAFVPRSGSAAWMCLWYSEDGGETYHATNPLKPDVNEFSMVVSDYKTGELLVNSRAGDFKTRKNYFSKDGGLTWDGPHESGLKDAVNDHGSGCEASIINHKNVLYFFNPAGGGPGDHPSRTNMRVQCSKDHGKTWKHSYRVTTTTEGGYSDLIDVSGDKLLLVWGVGDSNAKHPKRNVYAQTIDTDWCK